MTRMVYVDVWIVTEDPSEWRDLKALYLSWLTAEEKERRRRFVSDELQDRYLMTRAVQRYALSHHVPQVPPSAWRFGQTRFGKPVVVWPERINVPFFSLTHTLGAIGIAVCANDQIGFDMEASRDNLSVEEIVRTYFAPDESLYLLALGEVELRLRFLEFWTLKEALAKALGWGLSAGFDRIRVRPLSAEPSTFRGRSGHEWQLLSFWPFRDCAGAVAVRCGQPLHVTFNSVVPCLFSRSIDVKTRPALLVQAPPEEPAPWAGA